jgi:hypothetical protein
MTTMISLEYLSLTRTKTAAADNRLTIIRWEGEGHSQKINTIILCMHNCVFFKVRLIKIWGEFNNKKYCLIKMKVQIYEFYGLYVYVHVYVIFGYDYLLCL